MDYLHLTIDYVDFVKEYQRFRDELISLKNETTTDINAYKFKLIELNKSIVVFLGNSFTKNTFAQWYSNQYAKTYDGGSARYTETIETIKNTIDTKIHEINYQLLIIANSDIIKLPFDELFQKRQAYTIKQKREFILQKLFKLKENGYHSINLMYLMYGLKKDTDNESFSLGKKLESYGYVNFRGGAGGSESVQITSDGIEYIQELDDEAYSLYESQEDLSEEERDNLKNIFNDLRDDIRADIKEQFKDQEELIKMSLNALFEVIDESLKVIDSKLPKKTIRQIILGKIVEKGGDMALEGVMKLLLEKFKHRLMGNPDFTDLMNGAEKFLGS